MAEAPKFLVEVRSVRAGVGAAQRIVAFYVVKEDGRSLEVLRRDRSWGEFDGSNLPLTALLVPVKGGEADLAYERAWALACEHGAERPASCGG